MFKKIPHTYVIIFFLIIVASICTLIVPAGEFERMEQTTSSGKIVNQIIPNTFHYEQASPQVWQIMSAFFKGFQRTPAIISFILILGGAFWILNETNAINTGVQTFLKKSSFLEEYKILKKIGVNNLIIVLIMLMFSLFGAVFGMSEETIAFVVIFVPLAISMGYDSITGICMCFLSAGLGFAGCLLNPFTLGIAQDIAGIKMFSGIEYRLFIWFVMTVIGITFVLWYANRIKKHPQKSLTYQNDEYWRKNRQQLDKDNQTKTLKPTWLTFIIVLLVQIGFIISCFVKGVNTQNFLLLFFTLLYTLLGYFACKKSVQAFSLVLLSFTIAYLVLGVVGYDWSFTEIAALFFTMAIACGFAMGKDASDISQSFITGAKDILSAAMVVGLASGTIVILEEGKIIDTLLYGVSNAIGDSGKAGALSIMYGFQTLLNAIITSGTAKAAMLMPMFSEISNLVGVSLQSTVTAFHIGDGLTNLITPTSGVLIAVLGVARVPYIKWLKFAWKFIFVMVIVGWLLLLPTLFFSLPNF